MKDRLHQLFNVYIKYATAYLRQIHPSSEWKEGKKKISLRNIDAAYQLRRVAETIESSDEFNNLVLTFSSALGRKPKGPPSDRVRPERTALKNFLRRSRIYLNIYNGISMDSNESFEKLITVFADRNIKVTSLRLIEEVCFSENLIDFGALKIQRFSKKELDELCETQVKQVFYPYAKLDTERLSWYWFLRQDHIENRQRGDISEITIKISWSSLFHVFLTFPDRATQLLTLFDWESKFFARPNDIKSDSGWLSFSVPVSLSINDDIFGSPFSAPPLRDLEFFPEFNSYGKEEEVPPFYIHLDQEELERLKKIVRNAQKFLENLDLKACNWEFIDRAMGYLAKAYFTDGLEQLLWHITVLETLFGEKDEVMEALRSRTSSILGKTQAEKKSIRKMINELYAFRSDLVHGNPITERVYKGHLRQARKLARDSLLWFLTYLSTIKPELVKKEVPPSHYPGRKELLTLLGLKRENLSRLGFLIEKLPNKFPNIDIWG